MTITLTELLIWLIIAAIVGFIGEALAGRRGPGGLVGAILIRVPGDLPGGGGL